MIETRLIFVFLLLPKEWLELKKIKCIFARFYPSRKNQVIGEALKIRRVIKASLGAIVGIVLVACSPTRHVPDGSYLLDHVKIETDDKSVKPSDLKSYLRQEPNHRMFGLFRFTLGLYNLSGNDSTKWYNRWVRNAGTPPIIYDPVLIENSRMQMEKAMNNKGYMAARVDVDTVSKGKRMDVFYRVSANTPHYIDDIDYRISNDTISRLVERQYVSHSLLKKGSNFDRNVLDEERQRISDMLRRDGFYAFNKELITYTADTADRSKAVDLTMNLVPESVANASGYRPYERYYMRKIYFVLSYDPTATDQIDVANAGTYKNYYFVEGDRPYIRRETLVENCFIRPGLLFSGRDVDNTYTAFGRLRIVKYVNIRFEPAGRNDEGVNQLDCYILLSKDKPQSVSLELEGTNSEGDLGFAVGATYQHRNIFKGSETFSAKVRGAYESLSGDLSGLINDRYTELGGEIGVTYPKFLFPFLRTDCRRRMKASTEYSINLNFQQRPEYTRVIWGAAWKYKWTTNRGFYRHNYDLLDINYVYLPRKTDGFLENIAPDNPLLRYSYEDHFIMRMGYTFYCSNLNPSNPVQRRTNVYTLRAAGEIAGNVLNAFSKLTSKEPDGGYKIFGIRYSQYAKFDFDYSFTHLIDERNSIAFHVGGGIGIPYGNSDILPFEKRYYSGGANSVRGWSVRTLGPGSYNGNNSVSEFINQCGDIRLDINLEYRTKLFWKVELGAFIDAGNIWTIRDYESQPGGQFRLDSFYKEIALAYGLGIRLDFSYFLLRFDMGMKAYNPAAGQDHWAIASQNFKRDSAFHFTVGYPF